jgi:hypothetical protein
VSERAEAAAIDLHLLSPHVDDLAQLSPHVHAAGPGVGARAAALAAATRTRGTRARFTVAPGTERGLFAQRVRSLLGMAGVAVVDPPNLSPAEVHLVLGPWGLEARDTMQRHATTLHTRWVFDARSGPAGSPGVWVGLAAPDPSTDRTSHETLQRVHARSSNERATYPTYAHCPPIGRCAQR